MQQRISDQAAFILHRRDYQNSSLILELFTEDFGRLSVLAKGARSRRDAAHFQIANRLAVGWSGRSELKTLTEIDSRPLPIPADCYVAVFYINELLLYLLAKQDPHPQLFQYYQRLLLQLEKESLESQLRGFEMDLLTTQGLMPDLSCESQSAQPLIEDAFYRVHPQSGVVISSAQEAGSIVGRDLDAIARRQFDSTKVRKSAKQLLRQIIDFNLQGRTLQSRQFYQQLSSKKPT